MKVHSRAWRPVKNKGLYVKEDFQIDLFAQMVHCPAGKSAPISAEIAAFSTEDCGRCKFKSHCTTAARRTVRIHPQEDLLIQLRAAAHTRAGRAQLRRRTTVEHRLARVGAIQGPRARYRGVRLNELDLNRSAILANLELIATFRIAA